MKLNNSMVYGKLGVRYDVYHYKKKIACRGSVAEQPNLWMKLRDPLCK